MIEPAPSIPDPPPLPAPFTVGRAFRDTFRVFGAHVVAFGTTAALLFSPGILLDAAAPNASARLSMMLWNLLGCLVTAGVTRGTLDALAGRRPGVGTMLAAAFTGGLRILGVSILTGLATLLGFLLLVVPGLIAAAGLYVAAPAAVADGGLPATASLSASWSLTAGHRWGTLALATVFLVVALAVALATGALAEVAAGWGGIGPIVAALGGVVAALALALQSIAAAVTYRALHTEKAGVDAPALAAVFE